MVVLNPSSGTTAGQIEAVHEHAKHHAAQVLSPRSLSELHNQLAATVDRGGRRLVVCGGDGTISRVANAASAWLGDVEIGIVPMGTGNDLARALDLTMLDIESAFERAATHAVVPIDIVRVQTDREFFFVNAATAGFGAEITASLTSADKERWGAFAYWMTATTKLADMHPFDLQLLIDDVPLRLNAFGLTAANGKYTGGGFPVANGASLNDGWFDLVVVPTLSTIELLTAGLTFMIGWDSAMTSVISRRVRKLVIKSSPHMAFSFDGEPICMLDAILEVMPQRLLIVPGENAAIEASG